MKIDAHQHFWSVARGDYGWLTPDLGLLYRDYGPADLAPDLAREKIDGTILVQAAPTLAETHYMLDLAAAHDVIKGVVGWVDFEAPDAPQTIAALAAEPKLVGLRPMIQDIADVDWMLRPSLSPAFQAMIEAELAFDALTLPQHLPNLLSLLTRHPELRVVIDHASKPRIASEAFYDWAQDMSRLAKETSAMVKLSGLVTEAAADWTVADLVPYVAHLLGTFGAGRTMWGSDWPVCLRAGSYADWCRATDTLLAGLSQAQRAAIQGGNAAAFYKLHP